MKNSIKIRLLNQNNLFGVLVIQIIAVTAYIKILLNQYIETSFDTALAFLTIAWLIQLVVMAAISYGVQRLTAKKPPKPKHAKPEGLEQFDLPTAEEGRPVQVLFGKRYINAPNVIWYGDLKSNPIIVKS